MFEINLDVANIGYQGEVPFLHQISGKRSFDDDLECEIVAHRRSYHLGVQIRRLQIRGEFLWDRS